jgi:hypothetical protein
VGTVRIELIDEVQAGLGLIGARRDLQRLGTAPFFWSWRSKRAWSFGRSRVITNAHPTSLAFYLANGYREGAWRDKGPVSARRSSASVKIYPKALR